MMPVRTDRDALIALAHIAEPADAVIGGLVDDLGPMAVVDLIATEASGLRNGPALRARLERVDLALARSQAEQGDIRIVDRTHPQWPHRLDDLGVRRPFALWCRGPLDIDAGLARSVAVVGARASTGYGEAVCRTWCAVLVDHGLTVASGGAYGIDAAAHRATLTAGGRTCCVLAGGVDVPYPRGHTHLISTIAGRGLVLSESPLGEQVRRQRFLTRNRLIACLTSATLVVEAAHRSGSLATAHAAAELNRPVLVVPGPVTSPMSAGCHRLLREGSATVAATPDDVLEMVSEIGAHLPAEPPRSIRDDLSTTESRVLDAFPAHAAAGFHELMLSTGLPVDDIAAAIGPLLRRGLIASRGHGWTLAGRQ